MNTVVRISRCYPWDLAPLQSMVKETWIATYTPIMGEGQARGAAQRFTKPYLLWLITSGFLGAGKILKAIVGDRLVGMAYALPDDEEIILYMLYVAPDFQGTGLGTKLLRAIELWQPKAKAIRLETLQANAGAIAWYERRGFAIYGATENATGTSNVPAVYMEKRPPFRLK